MITVLRLGHRIPRDARTTTHCALVARAFGTDEIIVCGDEDNGLLESVRKLADKWGGKFRIRHEKNWRGAVRKFSGIKVHLTAYGLPVQREIRKIRKAADHRGLLIIIGGEKVPPEVYALADYNVAVTHQPHSEVAALAVFLHEFFQGSELQKKFAGARITIAGNARGKTVHKINIEERSGNKRSTKPQASAKTHGRPQQN